MSWLVMCSTTECFAGTIRDLFFLVITVQLTCWQCRLPSSSLSSRLAFLRVIPFIDSNHSIVPCGSSYWRVFLPWAMLACVPPSLALLSQTALTHHCPPHFSQAALGPVTNKTIVLVCSCVLANVQVPSHVLALFAFLFVFLLPIKLLSLFACECPYAIPCTCSFAYRVYSHWYPIGVDLEKGSGRCIAYMEVMCALGKSRSCSAVMCMIGVCMTVKLDGMNSSK